LDIFSGNFLSILGPNGSGKSTLLKIIANLLPYTTGSILIKDIELNKYNIKDFSRLVAYVPQKTFTIFPFSVYEVVMMGRTPYQNLMAFETELDRKIVNETLELFEIQHLKHKGLNEISGGEVQRVMIARALVQEPQIILLDEPNAHLDLEHQISTFNLLRRMNVEQGITIVNVSHDLNLVGIYSTEIAFMKGGKMKMMGEKTSVLSKENIKEIFNVETEILCTKDGAQKHVIVKPINN